MEDTGAAGQLLGEGVILLGFALALVLAFRRLGLGAVLGYLLAGALVGPQALGLVAGGEAMVQLGEIGIVLLLFLVGLELQPSRLWEMRREIFGLGAAQVAACGLALTGLIGWGLGFSWAAALALGLPLALSSTAQVLPSLKEAGASRTPFGERAFSILLFQDLSIVPLVTIIAALSRAPADPDQPAGWALALMTVAAVVGLWAAGRFLLTPLLRLVGRLGERELFVIVGLFVVLASAALMHALHLSTALGAFVAGVVLADSPYRHELTSDVEPFRSILLGLFFLGVGMVLDLSAVAARPLSVLGIALALVVVKTGVIFVIARLSGFRPVRALALGMLLSQGGEFGFVLFAQGADALLIDPATASLASAVVTVSMATTPFLMIFARWLRDRAQPSDAAAAPDEEAMPLGTAIVVGYGRFGQTVAQMLTGHGCGVTIVDKKPEQIELSQQFDIKVYYGDGLRLDLLRSAGAEDARLICFCTDDATMDAEALAPVRDAFPRATLLARAFDRRQLIALAPLDGVEVVREVYESAICMGRQALGALGASSGLIDRAVAEYRGTDAERLRQQTETGDLKAAKDMIYRPGNTMSFVPDEA